MEARSRTGEAVMKFRLPYVTVRESVVLISKVVTQWSINIHRKHVFNVACRLIKYEFIDVASTGWSVSHST